MLSEEGSRTYVPWGDSINHGEASDSLTVDPFIAHNTRNDLLAAYTKRYQSAMRLENQPSEATLNLIIKRNAARSLEFVQLSKVTNMIDDRDYYSEPFKLGKHSPIHLDGAFKRKTSDSNASPEAFAHAARVLMYVYVVASDADSGRPWRSLDAAQKHVSTVENLPRAPARAGRPSHRKILDAEVNVRCEWARVTQAETTLSLRDIIEIVSQRFTILAGNNRIGRAGVERDRPTNKERRRAAPTTTTATISLGTRENTPPRHAMCTAGMPTKAFDLIGVVAPGENNNSWILKHWL